MISISNPSSNSRFRSALRLISGCNIEHRAIDDLDRVTRRQRAVGMILRPIVIGDGEARVRSRRQRKVGDLDQLFLANLLFGPLSLAAVDDDFDFLGLGMLKVLDGLFEM